MAGAYNYNPSSWSMNDPNYYGMPQSPNYSPVYNPLSMNLTPEVQKKLEGIDTGNLSNSVDAFRQMAMRQGPSAWAQLAGEQQDALLGNTLERGANETHGQTAQALDELASSGGLTSGARERAAEGGAKNYMNMSQNASRQNSLNHLQIGVNDQQNKIQQLGMLPGMEEQALEPQFKKEGIWQTAANQNLQNTIAENQNANNWNQNLYGQQMQAWAADKQAKATQNSGKK